MKQNICKWALLSVVILSEAKDLKASVTLAGPTDCEILRIRSR